MFKPFKDLNERLSFKDLNETAISLEEVGEAVNEIKSGKAQAWMDFRWNV